MISQRDFVYPALMPATFEGGVQEGFERVGSFLLTDKSAGHYKNVGIVVFACETSYLFLPAQGGPYSLMFIECHGNSVAGSANGYSRIYFAGFYRPTLSSRVFVLRILSVRIQRGHCINLMFSSLSVRGVWRFMIYNL